MSNWTKRKPTVEGWYFWRSRRDSSDPWRWDAVYLLDERENGELEAWMGGAVCWLPTGGWWKEIVQTRREQEDVGG